MCPSTHTRGEYTRRTSRAAISVTLCGYSARAAFFLAVALTVGVCVAACKTAPRADTHFVHIFVADMFHISYEALPCTVHFEHAEHETYRTDINGRITVPLGGRRVIGVSYDFTQYQRPSGRLLARKDFLHVVAVRDAPHDGKYAVEVPVHVTRTCLILLPRKI
ncbi:hypothetical protein TPSea814_000987 [Treponema pallidum subsp. pallidum str. Sea 81-4]|nr:hypothetical protein TPSea814_000987 [Treponema pallidum subsp. pallidum str. Sea 81-4]